MNYGTIRENKDIANKEKHAEDKKLGYGLEETKEKQKEQEAKKGKKFGDGEIVFSRPKFARKKPGQFGGEEFKDGLEDLDDDGKVVKKDKKNTGDGQKEFINLGSSARPAKEKGDEEEKTTGVRPTFKGKANLKGTGGGLDNAADGGKNITYDFNVVYKGSDPKRDEKDGGDKRGPKKPKEKGTAFGKHQA